MVVVKIFVGREKRKGFKNVFLLEKGFLNTLSDLCVIVEEFQGAKSTFLDRFVKTSILGV